MPFRVRGQRQVVTNLDGADRFVHDGVGALVRGGVVPALPDDESWIARARSAGVLLPLVAALVREGSEPPASCRTLRTLVAARAISARSDLGDLALILARLEMPWALLKGPVLDLVVFEHSGTRESTDLDVLVQPDDVDTAVRALIESGAQLLDTDWDHVIRGRTAEVGLRLPRGTVLDLHWSLVNLGRKRDQFRLPTDELLGSRVGRDVGGQAISTLDDLDLVLHVLLHGCLSGAHQLRWLLDAQQCIGWLEDRGVAPSALAARARTRGVATPVRAMLERTSTHLDPGVGTWAHAMGASPWNWLLRGLTRRRPPSSPSLGSKTHRTFFAATRPTTTASFLAWGRTAAQSLRYRSRGWPGGSPRSTGVDDPGYDRWVAMAVAEARTDGGPGRNTNI